MSSFTTRRVAAIAALALIAPIGTGIAFADDVVNNVDGSVDATVEVVATTVGATPTSVQFRVVPTGGDGKNGCNLTSSSTLVVAVASSNAAVASLSHSSFTFGSCGDTRDLSITPNAAGSTTISLTQTSNTTAGTFNLLPATFRVDVTNPPPSDTTPPVVTVPGNQILEATSGAGAALSFTATANDDVDGSVTATCNRASGSTFALGTTTVTCTATDNAGNEGSASFTVKVQDTTAPTVTVGQKVTAEATSSSGAAVTYTNATATDTVDGSVAATCSPVSGSTFALGTTTVTCTATDNAGNEGSAVFTVEVQDTTEPTVNVPANITVGPTGITGEAVTYSASADDIVEGAVATTCTPQSGSTFGFGTTNVTCSATDTAGNKGTASFTVTVSPLGTSGFFSPVDMGGILNTVKSGSTVPLKFEVFAGSTELTDIAAVKSFTTTLVNCGSLGAAEDAIEIISTGGTSLRYDTSGGQFIQNWQTPKNRAGSCYRVTLTAVDGSTIVANFKLK